MTALRYLDVSWNPPLVMERSNAQLFAALPHFHRLVVRAWGDRSCDEIQVQQPTWALHLLCFHTVIGLLYNRLRFS